jgi:hypothetical protein
MELPFAASDAVKCMFLGRGASIECEGKVWSLEHGSRAYDATAVADKHEIASWTF